jgi:ABC-2 type transport system permease protein
MLKDVIAFEWRYHTRQLSFVAAVVLFFGFGFALTATGFGPDNVHIDSPYSIAQSIGMLSLLSVFPLAAFCANAIVRDREYKFEEILFTTSVEKLPFLGGRFAGSFLAAFTAFSACVVGMIVARFMPWQDAERLGSLSLVPYVWALLVIALPNLLFAAMVMFALATLTRSVWASYAGSVLIYVLYFVAAALTNSPLMAASAAGANEGAWLAPLLDPFALSAFFAQTEHWTAAMRNERLVELSGAFLTNRLVWIAVAVGGFAGVARSFAFRVVSKNKKSGPLTRPSATLSPLLGRGYWVLFAGLVVSELVSEIGGGEYGAAFYPTASLLFETIRTPLGLIAMILLTYVSGEIVWRERSLRFADILHATPASNARFVIPKVLEAMRLVVGLTLIAIVIGAVVQVAKGWPVEPFALVQIAWYCAAPLLLFAVAAITIQALSPQKYLGMLLVLLLGLIMLQGAAFGLRHPLLRFGAAPPVAHSDFNGFGDTTQFHLLLLYWTALTGLLLLVAIRRWRNGRRERISRGALIALAVVAIAVVPFIEIDLRDPRELRAQYEKQYKRYANAALPSIVSVQAQVDLGHDRQYRAHGQYLLRNATSQPIDTILVWTRNRTHVVRTHLAPSASMVLRFDVRGESEDEALYANALPHIGYRETYELEEPRLRRKYGLPPKTTQAAEHEIPTAGWSSFDVTISTNGATAVAPGTLLRQWDARGRKFFRYRTEGYAPHRFAIVAAHYAVTRATHEGTSIEIYHHPRHTQNVARMMDAAKQSLRTFNTTFGPYAQKHLRLAEVPVPNFSGYAYPGLVLLGEKRGFLIDARDPRRLDLVTRRTAHEIAHQWWGYKVIPARAPGASMLMESLTKYAELLVLEEMHGKDAIQQSLSLELDRYLKERTAERGIEPPLTQVDDQPYLYYRKGAIVLYAVRDLIGKERFHEALRAFLREQSGPNRTPTTAQLMQHLRAVTPRAQQSLVHEWLEEVVLYDFRLSAAKFANGELLLTLSSDRAVPVDIVAYDAEGKPLSATKHTLRNGQQQLRIATPAKPLTVAVDPYVLRIDRNRFDNTLRID